MTLTESLKQYATAIANLAKERRDRAGDMTETRKQAAFVAAPLQ